MHCSNEKFNNNNNNLTFIKQLFIILGKLNRRRNLIHFLQEAKNYYTSLDW